MSIPVLILVDNTGSMGAACKSVRISAEELGAISRLLLHGKQNVSYAVYGDFDRTSLLNEQGGWSHMNPEKVSNMEATVWLDSCL